MSAAFSRRRLAAAVTALAAVGALSACDKPNPTVTIVAGDTSAHIAGVSCTTTATEPDCPTGKTKAITAHTGDSLAFDVDKKVAHAGWLVTEATGDGTPLTEIQHGHFARIGPTRNPGTYKFRVIQLKKGTQQADKTWQFQVKMTD